MIDIELFKNLVLNGRRIVAKIQYVIEPGFYRF